MIPGSANPLLLASAAAAGGYQVQRSLRFSSSDSAYCSRTPAVAGDRQKWTWAGWVKRSTISDSVPVHIFSAGTSGASNVDFFGIETDNTIRFGSYDGAAFVFQYVTTQVFRDPSAWYHLVLAVDTTIASPSSDRVKFYVNGVQVTTFSTATDPGLSAQCAHFNTTSTHYLGKFIDIARYFPGYLADIHFIDGQALTPSSFTEVSATTGQLIPIEYTGTFGTNGFHLPFSDNSTTAALGTDTSGNGNTWTVNNISVGFPVTQNYSTTTTGTAPTPFLSTSYYALAFDGDTSTGFAWTAGTWAMDWTSLPSAVTVASTLRIYCYPRLGTLTVNINGSNVASITGNTVDWRTISFTGTINTISFNGTDTYSTVYAIEVDGAILIDPRANSVNDSLVDTPTSYGTPDTGVGGEVRGNYCTLNPVATPKGTSTFSNGNLEMVGSSWGRGLATILIPENTGKYYWEVITIAGNEFIVGMETFDNPSTGDTRTLFRSGGNGYIWNGGYVQNGVTDYSGYPSYNTSGTIVQFAFDSTTKKLWFGVNGTYNNSGNPATGANASLTLSGTAWYPSLNIDTGHKLGINFGQRAFAYTAPSGFKALCDTNLPTQVVAKPNTLMDVKLFSGNGSTQSITGFAFSPDFAWFKRRSSAFSHELFDVIRGGSNVLFSDLTSAEANNAALVTSFNSDGVSVGSALGANGSGVTSVMWAWDAGTSTVSNTAGSITSQVRANVSAGFSIVTWTADAGIYTVGHGLGVKPAMIIHKCRSNAETWLVRHVSIGDSGVLVLNTTAAAGTIAFGGTNTSTVFYNQNAVTTTSGRTMVAYCFAPVVGYSAALSWTGNGSNDGPMIHCGFSPRFWIWKRTDSSGDWWMIDTARSNTGNPVDEWLAANRSDAEYPNDGDFDFLSNGIKIRTTSTSVNASGGSYIGFAWASNPFQYARAQ